MALNPGWKWYAGYLAQRRVALILVIVGAGLITLTGLPALALVRYIFDNAIPAADIKGILLAGAGIVACRLATAVVTLTISGRSARVLRATTAQMRTDLVARLHRLRWIDNSEIDDARVHARIINETERVESLTQGLFQSAIPALAPLIAYGVVMLWLSWQMALLIAVLAPLTRLFAWWSTLRLKARIADFQEMFEKFHISTARAIQMLPVTRMQGGEQTAIDGQRRVNDALAVAGARMVTAGSANAQTNAVVTGMLAVFALVAGGIAVSKGSLTLGALAAFFVAANQTNVSLNALMRSLPLLLAGDEALARLSDVVTLGQEEPASGTAAPDLNAPLVLEGVAFGYPGRPVLEKVSMRIEPGALTALAAPNGEGKTTLLELVLGLHVPAVGEIRLGETPFAALDLTAWRRSIGVAPQNPRLFRGTVRENILFGRSGVDEEALARAIRLAALEPVLDRLSQGLETQVGDAGQSLSGGERQRVALARALVHRPGLLILDEPSNHLDAATVDAIIERLLQAPDRPTILMATHDPRLLALADSIYDLGGGSAHHRPALRLASALA